MRIAWLHVDILNLVVVQSVAWGVVAIHGVVVMQVSGAGGQDVVRQMRVGILKIINC